MSAKTIKKRKHYLMNFVNTSLHDPLIRSSAEILEFLSNDDKEAFENYKFSRKNQEKPDCLEKIWSLDEECLCDFSLDRNLYSCMADYIEISEAYEKELKKNVSNMINSTKNLSKHLKSFSKTVYKLQQSQETFFNTKTFEVNETLKNAFIKWSAYEEVNANNYEEDIKFHLNYKIKEKAVIKNLLKDHKTYYENFEKTKYINNKKGEQMKSLFGYFNYKIKRVVENVIEDNILFDSLHYKDFAKSETQKAKSLQDAWEGLKTSFYRNPKLI